MTRNWRGCNETCARVPHTRSDDPGPELEGKHQPPTAASIPASTASVGQGAVQQQHPDQRLGALRGPRPCGVRCPRNRWCPPVNTPVARGTTGSWTRPGRGRTDQLQCFGGEPVGVVWFGLTTRTRSVGSWTPAAPDLSLRNRSRRAAGVIGLMFAPVEPSGHVVAGDMPQSAVVDGDLGQERSDAGQPGRWTSTGGSRPASRPCRAGRPPRGAFAEPVTGGNAFRAAALSVPGRCEGDDPLVRQSYYRCRPGSPAAGVQGRVGR